MIGFALDSNNDIIVDDGQFKLVTDGAKVAQHVRSRLLFYQGEWFLDLSAGVPYFQKIFTKPADVGEVESIIKSEILQTEGVERLLTFESDYNSETRKLTMSASLETVYGVIDMSEVTLNV